MAKKNKNEKDQKDAKSVKRTVVRSLPCKLSEKELAKAGQDLAANMDKIEAIKEAKKITNAGFEKDIGLLDEVATGLRNMLKTGTQEREVKCEEETDYRHGEVRVKRLDTGETFQKRNMSKEETQLPLMAKPTGKLLALEGGKDRSEVKDVKKEGDAPEPKTPTAGDTIEIETRHGWKSGKVLPSSGSMLDVDVGEDAPVQAPIESQMWRWPKAADPLKATVGELAQQTKKGKKRGKKDKNNPNGVDLTPPEGCDF